MRRPACNPELLGFYGRLQRAGPAQFPPDPVARAHHRQVAPVPATSAKYTMPLNMCAGTDHFRAAVAKMMLNVTFSRSSNPVNEHHNTSLQRKLPVKRAPRRILARDSIAGRRRMFSMLPVSTGLRWRSAKRAAGTTRLLKKEYRCGKSLRLSAEA